MQQQEGQRGAYMVVCAASQNFSKPTSPHTQQWWVDCWSLLLELVALLLLLPHKG